MSHHEGVSCDSCLKGNFNGRRFKCLVCFDYDLCATCYEAGTTSTRHSIDHPMQCILTRSDFDLFYGGESISVEQPQSFTCPFCGKMGLTEATLQEHVTSEHADSSTEVVCPVCASLPGGEPNHVTDDFATHLTLEHRSPRELEEPQTAIRGRRAPHPSRGMNSTRTRRSQMQFNSSSGIATLSPSNRDMDPIAELLSQLSGVRRAANMSQSHSPQLQQLQMQLQLERQSSGQSVRQPFDRAPIERVIRRHQQQHQHTQQTSQQSQSHAPSTVHGTQQLPYVVLMEPSPSPATLAASAANMAQISTGNSSSGISRNLGPQFLLTRCNENIFSESEQQQMEIQRIDRSLFVQELLITTLTDSLNLEEAPSNSSCESLQNEQNINNVHDDYDENSSEKDSTAVENENDNHSILNCNENETPLSSDLYNTLKQNNSSQPLQQQHPLQQYPVLQRRQQNKIRLNSSRSTNTASNNTTGRNANARTDSQTGATSPTTSTRRKLLRGQSNEPPPH